MYHSTDSEKILKGKLQEDLYSWPDQKQIENGESCPPQLTKQTIYGEDQVTYMSDKLGLHRISNPDPNDFAVSLHRMCILQMKANEELEHPSNRHSLHTTQCRNPWVLHLR